MESSQPRHNADSSNVPVSIIEMTEPPLVTNSEPTPTTEMHATEGIPEVPTVPQTPEIIFVKHHMSRFTPLPCPGAISGNKSTQLPPRCRQRARPELLV